ncbi:MAG: hypothetical protein FDZ72_12165 [Betaproteobacteria bacterium]|nr:MAG: hypothetical protein FDZ72_12165 [Betaproteobacteria bacterium]
MMAMNKQVAITVSCWSDTIVAIVIGASAFWLIVGFGVLDTSNILWLTTVSDTTTHYLGWVFYRNDGWHWPPGLNPNYGLEYSSSVIFSDSIPLVAFVVKLFAGVLPPVFQYSGWWLFLCFILQAYFSIRLLRLVSDDPWIVYLGVILFVFSPPMLWRLGGHFSMVAHWLVLIAIYMYFSSAERALAQTCKWALLLACAAVVHTYLFAMILPVWGANVYKRAQAADIRLKEFYPEILVVIGSALCALWLAGFFPLRSSYLSGGYGVHRINLLSLFNPHGVASVASDQWSYVLPAVPQGAGDYEGFNYLGLGGILIFVLAIAPAIKYRRLILTDVFKPLAIACLLLTVFAITNHLGFGGVSLDVWLPKFVIKIANVMRASGRFFWPVFYIILLACIWLISKTYPRAVGISILALSAVLQVADTQAGWRQFHEKFSLNSSVWPQSIYSDERVLSLVSAYPRLRALPAANAIKDWDHLVNLATSVNIPTDVAYLARANDAAYASRAKEVDELLRSGQRLPEDSVYFLNREFATRVIPTMAAEDRMFVLSSEVLIYAPAYSAKGLNVSLPVASSLQDLGVVDEKK